MTRASTIRSAAVLAAAAMLATHAHAQHGLGDGRALDRNLQVGSGGLNPTGRDFAAELRFRNAVITGNAPGGLSFRGDLPYSDVGDFRGDLGSDDLFAFRRDSLYSGLAGLGIRGTDALQYQFALTTGSRPSPMLTGPLTTDRFGSGSLLPRTRPGLDRPEPIARVQPDDPEADARGTALWSLRSTSTYASTRSFAPSLVDLYQTEDQGVIGLTASPLLGLRAERIRGLERRPDEQLPGARPRDEEEQPRRDGMIDPMAADPGALPGMREERFDTPARPSHPLIGDRLTAYEAARRLEPDAEEEFRPAWERALQEVREFLSADEEEGDAPREGIRPGLGEDVLDLLREGPGRIDTLVPRQTEQRDPYSEHMRAGQSLMARGRYFEAEERFTRALAHNRGDTMALVGRIHAQIGAGLFVSANLDLRSLLNEHPEIAGIRFGRETLPARPRLEEVKEQLRRNIRDETLMPAESALLLAYLGFQTRESAAMDEGLDAMALTEQNRRLAELLRAVWVEGRSPVDPDQP